MAWRVTGVDPEGLDLALGDANLRLSFPHPVADGAGLRTVLKAFADQARTAG
jgi:heme oxygenase (biliverdin-IX-beta and delta-forming)